jgi:D-arabinose 1-dehydrogenase-like Zn-dependent alcohol dehydrogenase
MGENMKAAVVESAGKLIVRELSEPEMGEYEAKCEMLYGAVCTGTDTHLINFHAPFCYWMTMPYILGHESIGRVVKVGIKVRNLKVGDTITRVGCPAVDGISSGWGGFAEIGIASDWRAMQEDGISGWQDKTVQQILPADIDPAVGTLFITWRETLSYVTRMGIKPGVSVLITGSGGNGLAFATHAKNLGAANVVIVGSDNRKDNAALAGATGFVDYKSADCWEKVKEIEPSGYDFVIDAVGKASMVAAGQEVLKTGGTIGIYGLDEAGSITLSPGNTFTFFNGGYDEAEAHEAVLKFYRAGKLNPAVWINREQIFALSDINEAFEAVKNRVVVKPLVKLCP